MSLDGANTEQWLRSQSEADMGSRGERARFVRQLVGPQDGWFAFHDLLAKQVVEEAGWCYINGQFIGCVVLCQCFLENTFRGWLAMGGSSYGVTDEWIEKAGFYVLIEKATEYGLVSPTEAGECHWLRKTRVGYVHHRPAWSDDHFARRMVQQNALPHELHQDDAERALELALNILRRDPWRIREESGDGQSV